MDKHKRRMTGEDGSKQKVSKQDPVWRIPGTPPPRGITNPGGQCAINVAMKLYFHIPSITHIPGLQQIQTLKSNLDRYGTGESPLTLGHLHSIFPQSTKTSAQDVGEILDKISTFIPKDQEGLPLITLLDPKTSIYSSLQKCQTWNYSQGDGDKNTLIFQINRVSLKGQKWTSNMTYPIALDLQKCQSSKGQKTDTHHTLKTVVVHKGSSVTRDKGHYVVYIQPTNSRNWALFDDQTVSWVQEEEVIHQGANLLIYSRQPPPTLFGESRANQMITDRLDPPNSTTSRQRQGRDSIGTVPPGNDEKHPNHPVSPPLTRVSIEQDQPKNIPVRTPHTTPLPESFGPGSSSDPNMDRTRTGYCIIHQVMQLHPRKTDD